MAEIWLEMVVKQQLVSLLIYGTPSTYDLANIQPAQPLIQILKGL